MDIGFVGAGKAARALGAKWSAAGHSITLGSREPGRVDSPHRVVSLREAAEAAEVVVNATPGAVSLPTLESIGSAAFAGKTLIDIANAFTPNQPLIFPDDSLGERIQQLLPEAKVVKTLNTLNIAVMTNPAAVPASTVFISGNDAEAKKLVGGLLADLGWPTDSVIDLGRIATARGQEHYFILFATLFGSLGKPLFNIRVVQ
jgi:8-hydroxy-5-deazaflavin:NADPH oxidoreductase